MDAADNNRIEIAAHDISGVEILNIKSALGYTLILNPGWHHLMLSVNTNQTAVRFYIDNQAVSFTIDKFVSNEYILFEVSDSTIDEMTYEIAGGALVTGNQFQGCLAQVWLTPNFYLDLDQPVNRAFFITDQNAPANLGLDGRVPLAGSGGLSPRIYLRSGFDVFGTNSGTRGDFTIVGTPTVCFTNPQVGF